VDGFDVARHLAPPRPLLVFQTAYDEYALRAFEHAALDYLVKPVTLDGLRRALGRARERLRAPAAAPDPEVLRGLRVAVRGQPPRRPRLLVREGRGHRLVAFDAIARFSADEGVVYAHLDGGERRLTDYTLAELEERAGEAFVRASRGELVNADAVERIVRNGDGSATLGLRGGATVHVSRRRAPEVWACFEA
jgi:DNA-binding LytR/AlgR family response regulator